MTGLLEQKKKLCHHFPFHLLFQFDNPVLIQEAYVQITFLLEFQTNFKQKPEACAFINAETSN